MDKEKNVDKELAASSFSHHKWVALVLILIFLLLGVFIGLLIGKIWVVFVPVMKNNNLFI